MSRTIDRARALARSAQGPIAPHLDAFASSLIAQQYSAFCVHHKLYRAAQFSAWLAQRSHGATVPSVDEALVECYLRAALNNRTRSRGIASFELQQLLCFLRERGLFRETRGTDLSRYGTLRSRLRTDRADRLPADHPAAAFRR